MSGTGASVKQASGGAGLPAPKVQFFIPAVPADVFVSDGGPSSGTTAQAKPTRYVKVTVPGIPAAILNDITGYAPQVELVRYVRRQRRDNANGGNGGKGAAYVHPAHGPAPYGGSFTHGGVQGGTGAGVQAIRPTEWPILAGNDTFDVTQGILGFMCLVPVQYRDNTGNNANSVGALVPSHGLPRGRGGAYSRFPYQKVMSGAYFAFRLSVLDKGDARKKRIWGPVSDIVQCGNTVFPFVPNGLDPSGYAAAAVHPNSDKLLVNFWSMSRLP